MRPQDVLGWRCSGRGCGNFASYEATSAGTCHLEFPQSCLTIKKIKHFIGISGAIDFKRAPCHVQHLVAAAVTSCSLSSKNDFFLLIFYLGKLGDRYLANLSKKEIYWHGPVTGAPSKCLTPSCAGQNNLIYNIYLFPAYKFSHTMALAICWCDIIGSTKFLRS